MAVWSTGLFSSKIFTFIIGENETPMSVHADAFARQSVVLDTLINGSMNEAQARTVVWRDVEEETFIRFCQFVYTGNYKTPEYFEEPVSPDRVMTECIDLGSPTPEPAIDMNYWVPSPKPLLKKKGRPVERYVEAPSAVLKREFNSRKYDIRGVQSIIDDVSTIRPNNSNTENYTPVFLGHAQLYVLAEKYGVEDLKKLVLYKLHKTLDTFTLYPARAGDVVELARYTFSDDHTQDRPNCEEEIRSLVISYILSNLIVFKTCAEFIELVEEGGAFGRDLLLMTLNKLII